jgi:hypothetical protein
MLLAATLASCTLGQPAPRPTQPLATPAAVSPLPTATALPSQPVTTPAVPFGVESVRTIGDKPDMVPGQVILKLQGSSAVQALAAEPEEDGVIGTGLAFIDRLNQFYGVYAFEPLMSPLAKAAGESVETLGTQRPELVGFYLVSFDPQYDPNEVASAYEADPAVIYAEPNYVVYASDQPLAPPAFVPNDPFFSFQWHMPLIQAPQAWDVSTGQGVLIAVLDTGVAYERRVTILSTMTRTPTTTKATAPTWRALSLRPRITARGSPVWPLMQPLCRSKCSTAGDRGATTRLPRASFMPPIEGRASLI